VRGLGAELDRALAERLEVHRLADVRRERDDAEPLLHSEPVDAERSGEPARVCEDDLGHAFSWR
jgi:hypothetical protein